MMIPRRPTAWLTLMLVSAAVLAASCQKAVAGERRIGLVIGVSTYRMAPALRNTPNDANGMARALKRLGFEVDLVLNPDRAVLESAVRQFGAGARGADVALLFYAGHAVEAAGRNWLLPISADLRSARDLRFEAIDLDSVLEQLDGGARTTLIILDACRDNPFRSLLGEGRGAGGQQGLAQVSAAVGTLIAFSTAPGTVAGDGMGPNSPFTTALLKHIETPGLEFRQMLDQVRRDVREATRGRQVPWDQSSMEGALYLKPVAAPAAGLALGATATGESLFWDSVRNSTDPAEFTAYLARFPDGLFIDLARARLAALDVGRRPPAPAISGLPTPAPLLGRLVQALSAIPANDRENVARRYMAEAASKALTGSPEGKGSWRVSFWPTPAIAEERALEGCQIRYGSPCILLARDDQIVAPTGQGPARDMPHVRFAGPFAPEMIPAIGETVRGSAEVQAYAAAGLPKAMAIHPWGKVFAVTKAASATAAQEQALAACNADPIRKGNDGPCYLYAIANQVVLPRRVTTPDWDYGPIAAAVNLVRAGLWDPVYATRKDMKAYALHLESGRSFYWDGLETQEAARQLALEGCEQQNASPCILLAAGATLVAPDPRVAAKTPMERLRYRGSFDPEKVPFLRPSVALRAYSTLAEPKAIAVRPRLARLSIIFGAASPADAQRRALAECNADGSPFPCFVYAVGNQVVLPDRRTEPVP